LHSTLSRRILAASDIRTTKLQTENAQEINCRTEDIDQREFLSSPKLQSLNKTSTESLRQVKQDQQLSIRRDLSTSVPG
jgi:hypothetical protein